MNKPHRRRFLTSSLAVGAGVALANTAAAIEPIRRHGSFRTRLSLAAYSFRRYLNLRAKPRPEMTYPQFIDAAARWPLDAVELTAYYFPETSNRYLANLKGQATRLGLDISGTAIGNNFCFADAKRLKMEIAAARRWIEHTSRLGGKTIRIFAGRVDRGDTEEAARKRCIGVIQEVCEYAGEFGIYLALENHGGITATPEQMLAIVRAVKSDWFGVNFDSGNFHGADPYAELAQIAPYAVNVQLKTEIRRQGKQPEEADLRRFAQMLRKVNYRGYVALEYEASEDPKKAVPRYLEQLRKLFA